MPSWRWRRQACDSSHLLLLLLLTSLLQPSRGLHISPPSGDDPIHALLRAATAVAESNFAVTDRPITPRTRYWSRMGHSGQVPEEVAMLREVSSRPGIATVCEIGMNAGHSALCMLEGRKTNLVEFDLFQLRYSNATARFLDALYPGRISFHPGSSLQTVPVYARNVTELGGAPPCDAFFIDGDHGHGAPSKDLEHALRASSDDAVIVMDDCAPRFPQVVAAWQNATAAGLVMPESQTVLHLPEPAGMKGWCIGRKAKHRTAAGWLPRGWFK
mmetsp:Transcript_56818/g.123524  ORF Transcript_56818/g.123524 Transcript_56818/m.123524 type:complete len:272 (-) Transcript_56818:126-941(-)